MRPHRLRRQSHPRYQWPPRTTSRTNGQRPPTSQRKRRLDPQQQMTTRRPSLTTDHPRRRRPTTERDPRHQRPNRTPWTNDPIPVGRRWPCPTSPNRPTLYTMGHKNVALYLCLYLCQLLTDFQNVFTGTHCGQFTIMLLLYILPHGKCVPTLPCEM